MMVGHLSIASFAELAISGGLIAYLQRANPELLAGSMPSVTSARAKVANSTRRLWYWLAGLMLASPLGLLAAGTAWGEWGVDDFSSAEARHEMLQASGGVAPPEVVPSGLERLASLWSAPIPDYAPAFLHDLYVGYAVSAVMGAGLIVLLLLLIAKLIGRHQSPEC